jgi:hypothetical protein
VAAATSTALGRCRCPLRFYGGNGLVAGPLGQDDADVHRGRYEGGIDVKTFLCQRICATRIDPERELDWAAPAGNLRRDGIGCVCSSIHRRNCRRYAADVRCASVGRHGGRGRPVYDAARLLPKRRLFIGGGGSVCGPTRRPNPSQRPNPVPFSPVPVLAGGCDPRTFACLHARSPARFSPAPRNETNGPAGTEPSPAPDRTTAHVTPRQERRAVQR